MIPEKGFDEITSMTESFSKILSHVKFLLFTVSVMNQKPAIILCIKLQVLWGEEGGVGGDGVAAVQGNKNMFVKNISKDIIAVVNWMVEKLVDSCILVISQLEFRTNI